jgi:predicted MFS family arabinose efflux permease
VLLRTPQAPRAFLASTVARLSYGTVILSMLLTVQRATGSYAVAGACLGAYGVPTILGPLRSRAIDRRGARAVLLPLAAGYSVALIVIAACAGAGVRAAAPYAISAFVAGVLAPPVGPVMRGIWAALSPEPAARQRAYSLDAVVEEVIYASGPVVVGAVIALASPLAALLVTAALALGGCVALATSPLAVAPLTAPAERDFLGPLRVAPLRAVLVVITVAGAGLASVDLAVAARLGNGPAVGYVLAALSVGSAIGGLAWGRREHRRPYRVQLAGMLAVMAAGMVGVAAVSGAWWLALLLGLTGLAIAPVFVVAFVVADALVPPGSRTEATTWVTTAGNVGGAAGAAAFGAVVDHVSARAALLLAAVLIAGVIPVLALARRGSGRQLE